LKNRQLSLKQESFPFEDADCSCLQVEVQVEESWVDRFLGHHDVIIPVSDQYHLVRLKAALSEGKLILLADIQEKEGSSIRITCLPRWDVDRQRILLEELEIKMLSKNILLKSAGWFASTFMGAKIDKKIEEATSQMYATQLGLILQNGINIPIPGGGSARVQVRSILINNMTFLDHGIKVNALIDGYWKLHLLR
jgi:hypothetical protein